jgi:hypothetical protein
VRFASGLPDVIPEPFSVLDSPVEPVSDIETCESVEDLPTVTHNQTEKLEATAEDKGTSDVQEAHMSNTNNENTTDEETKHAVVYSKILSSSESTDETATEDNNREKLYATVRMDIKKEKKFLNYVELDVGALMPKYT